MVVTIKLTTKNESKNVMLCAEYKFVALLTNVHVEAYSVEPGAV